jgi:hypothetical protein
MKIARCAPPLVLISQAFAAPHIHALIIDGQNNHNWKSTTPVPEKILLDWTAYNLTIGICGLSQRQTGLSPYTGIRRQPWQPSAVPTDHARYHQPHL